MTIHSLLRYLIRETLLNEGVYDPGILKCVFMAGGPGSGKSFTAKNIFGTDPASAVTASTTSGLKLVNTDPAFEHFLKKSGVSPSDLASMSPAQFKKMTVGRESPRGRAKRLKGVQQSAYMGGRLGLVIDGTGDDYTKIKVKYDKMREAGYDCFMIFVNTSLEVAQERNANRDRKLPKNIVEDIWQDVQQNLGRFQALFGADNMAIVDNTEYGPIPKAIAQAVNGFLQRPIENHIGREWIEQELKAKGSKAALPKQKSKRGSGSKANRRMASIAAAKSKD